MPREAKLSVTIPGRLADAVQAAVDRHEYPDADEVVRQALEEWVHARQPNRLSTEELRRLYEEGIASGPARPLDLEALKRRGREALRREREGR